MKKAPRTFVIFTMLTFFFICTNSSFSASKDEAKNMVMKALDYYKANGKEKLITEINKKDGMFVKGDVYVYVVKNDGICLAHPLLPNFVGKNFMNLKDADGKLFIKEALDKLKTSNDLWLTYKWNNPVTKKISNKIGYFLKVDDMFFSCGVWE